MRNKTFTETVWLSHNDGRTEPIEAVVEFTGLIDSYGSYYTMDTEYSFAGDVNLEDFDQWEMDVRDSLKTLGFKLYE